MSIQKKIKLILKNLNKRADTREISFYHKNKLKIKLFISILKEFIFIIKNSNISTKSAQITFTFILAIVPFLSILFTLVHSIHGFENVFTTSISPMIKKHFGHEVGIQISDYLQTIIKNIQVRELGIISFVTFSVTVIMLLLSIEDTFNEMMHFKNDKSIFQRFIKCWIIITVSPFLFALTAIKSDVLLDLFKFDFPHFIEGPLIKSARFTLGLSFQSLYFIFLYYVMPSKRLNFKSALIGGVFASIGLEILQHINIFLAKSALSNDPSKIYGTVPLIAVLFFAWIRFAWIVTLSGASFSLATQRILYQKKDGALKEFPAKEIIQCITIYCSISKFYKESGFPVPINKILAKTNIPTIEGLKSINFLMKKNVLYSSHIDHNHCYSPSYKALKQEKSTKEFLSHILFSNEIDSIKDYDDIEKYFILCLKGNTIS